MILSSLYKIREVSSKPDKAYMIDEIAKISDEYKELLNIIFDKDVRFFTDTKKIKKYMSQECSLCFKTCNELDMELLQLLKLLASEEIRGDAAHTKCANYADQLATDKAAIMFFNILDNKTRLGIGATDINKHCKHLHVNQFQVMFAQRMDKIKKVNPFIKYFIQPKIDGNRCIKDGNTFLSRTGKVLNGVSWLSNEFKHNVTEEFSVFMNGFVLDGEIENGGSLESTGAIRRESEQATDAIYTVFGAYPRVEWESKEHNTNYDECYAIAKTIVERIDSPNVRIIPSFTVYEKTEEMFSAMVQNYFNEFVSQGYEGAVLKTYNHVYQPSTGTKRSHDWIKIKPQESTEGVIIDILEGEGEHQGQVGKFVIKWLDVECELAPGKIKHEDRVFIFENKNLFINKTIEFVYQELSAYGVPRHAFAIKIREDV